MKSDLPQQSGLFSATTQQKHQDINHILKLAKITHKIPS